MKCTLWGIKDKRMWSYIGNRVYPGLQTQDNGAIGNKSLKLTENGKTNGSQRKQKDDQMKNT